MKRLQRYHKIPIHYTVESEDYRWCRRERRWIPVGTPATDTARRRTTTARTLRQAIRRARRGSPGSAIVIRSGGTFRMWEVTTAAVRRVP